MNIENIFINLHHFIGLEFELKNISCNFHTISTFLPLNNHDIHLPPEFIMISHDNKSSTSTQRYLRVGWE